MPENGRSPLRVFLSYGHDTNSELVQRIRRDLSARGHDVWIDESTIRAGDDWRRTILQGIIDSDQMVSFLSRHAVRSPGVCLDELRIALARGTTIRPVLVEEEHTVLIPATLSGTQWLDMSDWRARRDSDPEAFEEWYRQRLGDLVGALESPDLTQFAGEIARLQDILDPPRTQTKERWLLEQSFVGREWLLRQVQRWRDSERERALLVIGSPGTGKSRFAAERSHYDEHIVCAVFLERGSGLDEANAVIRTLAFKMATKMRDYRANLLWAVRGAKSSQLKRLRASELFELLITTPLASLLDGDRPRSIVVLDGLDEAGEDEANELARLLAEHLPRLPRWFGLLLFSRPEVGVLHALAELSPLRIEQDARENVDDIRTYLAAELQQVLVAHSDPHFLLERIVQAAAGNFLHASLVVEAVRVHGADVEGVASYPSGLTAFYHAEFQRRFPRGTWPGVRSVFELLVAMGSVPGEFMVVALGRDIYWVQDAMALLGAFVRGDGHSVHYALSHKSLADWLGDASSSGRFHANPELGSRVAATAILRHLAAHPQVTQGKGGRLSGLDDYCRRMVIPSLVQGKMWSDLQEFLLSAGTPLWPYWSAVLDFPPEWDHQEVLAYLYRHPDRDDFLRQMQRGGDVRILKLVQGLEDVEPGIDLRLANLHTDALHLIGNYAASVSSSADYLRRALADPDNIDSAALIGMQVRHLHLRMMIEPVEPLWEEALRLESGVVESAQPGNYAEVLFLLGGNLGLLRGELADAAHWLARCAEFAQKAGVSDTLDRVARKRADLLCLAGHADAAVEELSALVDPAEPATSRYRVYLLGALGEAYRHTGRRGAAVECFEALRREALRRGIRSWVAHAHLGMALLLHDEPAAVGYLERARAGYAAIQQRWGMLNVGVVQVMIDRDVSSLESLAAEARRLEYRREAKFIETGDMNASNFHLCFL